MKVFLTVLYAAALFVLLIYVSVPSPVFPSSIPGSVQSLEEGDNESVQRRAYFTNLTRLEVLDFYQNEFSKNRFYNIKLPSLRLNYPPEESQTLIRDQTRSTFLEEVVHPLRESLFVNGFEPKEAKDEIWYKGEHFRQKIIIKYIPSNTLGRILVVLFTGLGGYLLLFEWQKTLKWIFRS